jgi:hemerythrin
MTSSLDCGTMQAMSDFVWKPAFSVHNKALDDQHKQLIHLMQTFYTAHLEQDTPRAHRELASLLSLTVAHFKAEEEMMKVAGFPDYESHKKTHEELLGTVNKLAKEFLKANTQTAAGKLANFLKAWLTRHILGSDKQYEPYLSDKTKPLS